MKRGIIYNNGHTIVIPDNEIWMTAWEIADLFYVTPNSINHAVKRVLKEGVLIESQVCRYTCLENGNYADVYNGDGHCPILSFEHGSFHIVPEMADAENIHFKPF